ncbi:MAG: ABC transporter ATP-binding protein [Clostridia bacterium]|nr:ABC transporter ATP-binding protein [Clostridia bacterium]
MVDENIPDEEIAIQVKNVSADYLVRDEKVDNLKEWVVRFFRGKLEKKRDRRLIDVSFTIRKGESIGVIGHNGAGKSTLLKILTDIMEPAEGTVRVEGKVAPLINLGAGFDYEATAKENVYLNGAILGYSRKEIEQKYKEIVEFAELGDYMHIPLKNFSSGMVARLGFAIAIDVNPDILLVDEILSVGDESFRAKCAEKIEEMRKDGVSFVIVSHNLGEIKRLCQKTIWIENARVRAYGDSAQVCAEYLKYCDWLKKNKKH